MKPAHKRLFTSFATSFTVLSILINLLFPTISLFTASIAYAQEVTEEPTVIETPPAPTETAAPTEAPSEEATEAPTTDAPAEVPSEEATEAPTAEATTEPTAATEPPTVEPTVATDEPTAIPTEPPALLTFQDDFQDGNTDGWLLTPGWQLTSEGDNLFLSALTPNETATISNIALEHFALAARVRMVAGNTASVAVRVGAENYTVTLDASGHADLYRGATLLAAGPAIEPAPEGTLAPWHTLSIQALGGALTVSVNGLLQIEFTDPAPLMAGAFVFSTGAANTGAVAFDQVLITELEASVVVPTVEPTIEATAEVMPEVTEEPIATETPTAEPTPSGTVVLTADFEGELTGWALGEGASVVVESETNRALLMAAGSSLLPADALYLADFQLDARLNIVSDAQNGQPSGASIFFRTQEGSTYVLSVEAGQTVLSRNDGSGLIALTSSATPHALNSWHTISLNAQGGQIVVTVNGVPEIDYTDATPLISGQIAFVANAASNVMLDDIVVTDFTSAEALAAPTMTPLGLTDEDRNRLSDAVYQVLQLYLSGDEAGALELARAFYLLLDDAGRIRVEVWATTDQTGASIAPIIETVGGTAEFIYDGHVEAVVPLAGFVPLLNTPQIDHFQLPSVAVSTGNYAAPAEEAANAPFGSFISEGFDDLGAADWHAAGKMGSGQSITVIDTGFQNVNPAERCGGVTGANTGTGNHGTRVMEVLCDIVPSATIRLVAASTASQIATAIENSTSNIILITLDMGVDQSPGDGDGPGDFTNDLGYTAQQNVYDEIRDARAAGRLVIVGAGNNNGRFVSFTYTSDMVNVPINVTAGDVVRISWSDWTLNGTADLTTAIVNLDGDGDVVNSAANDPSRQAGEVPGRAFTIANTGTCTNNPSSNLMSDYNYCDVALQISGTGSFYVQVQVQSTIGTPDAPLASQISSVGTPSGGVFSNVNTASSIGRPGDATPDATTVGAVCATQGTEGYQLLSTSSRGPIFGAGGAAPVGGPFTSRTQFKPDLVGPSEVTTSLDRDGFGPWDPDPDLADPSYGDGILLDSPGECSQFDNDGFTGTSAAAAHVAGMAALIRSANTSPVISNITNSYAVSTPQGIIDYMQSHSIELYDDPFTFTVIDPGPPQVIDPIEDPNGFDLLYGAGMPVLGNPAPTFPIRSTSSPSPVTTCNGDATPTYVDPGNVIDDTDLSTAGAIDDGFISPAQAVQVAGANECVVLLPGEYVSYNIITGNDGGWTGSAPDGVSLQSYDFAVDGVLGDDTASLFWVNNGFGGAGGGITIRGADTDIIGFIFQGARPLSDTVPTAFPQPRALSVLNGTGNLIGNNTFTNFGDPTEAGGSAVQILNGLGMTIELNTFSNNDGTGGSALRISGSNPDDVPGTTINNSALVQNNVFTGNNSTSSAGLQGIFDPVVHIELSLARIYNNRFTDNGALGIIRVANPPSPQNPQADNYEVRVMGNLFMDNDNRGPVVHLVPGQTFRFINNTVAANTAIQQTNPPNYDTVIFRGNPAADCATSLGCGNWDIFNNVFYNNSVTTLIDEGAQASEGCNDIAGGPNDDGVRNNWVFPVSSQILGGDCSASLGSVGTPANNNIFSDPTTSFIGSTLSPTDPYQLRTGTAGVDTGITSAVSGILALDVLGSGRISDGDGDTTPEVDIGAYELTPLTANDATVTPNVPEDTASVPLPFSASGGFPPYTFEIAPDGFPANFNTTTGSANPCNGLPVFFNPTTQQWLYCPPPNFYTEGGPAGSPTEVIIEYQARDAGDQVSIPGTVTINIDPTDDPATPLTINQNVLAEVSSNFSFRLRPYVRFNNFRFSEPSANPTASPGADYPYNYDSCTVTAGDPNIIVGGEPTLCNAINNLAETNGSIVALQAGATVGSVTVTYTFTDDDGDNPVIPPDSLSLTINIVGSLPDSGLHDDTSFAFMYNGNWTPIYSESNINNTLHRTMTLNSQADFFMIGTGFVLYMQGFASGGNWELQIDGQTIPWNGIQVVTANDITCRTSQTTSGNFISNRTRNPYVVSCDGLLENEPHTLSIINRAALQLNVDAVGIIEPGATLRAGVHEVNEPQTLPLFLNGWTQISDTRAVGGIAMSTTNPNVADITFNFQGTGFAIGTILERNSLFQGAQYDICVAPASAPTNQACQSFDNTLSATTAATWNIYRPFFGFNPTIEHTVTIDVTSITGTTGRMVIDSIVVFDHILTGPLALGDTEDDQQGLMVFGGGMADNWTFDTNNSRTSNRSLTSIISTVPKAGPFISFQIPDNADTINWFRFSSTRDSRNILVCVDRGEGSLPGGGDQDTFCIERDLRTSGNPLVIRESDFNGGAGWGAAWDPDGSGALGTGHMVEIFSLANETFNMDKVQVINSSTGPALLAEGYYEETITGVRWFTEVTGTYDLLNVGDTGNFALLTQTSASGRSVMRLLATGGAADGNGLNEGMFFQFTGTGFSVYFTLDRRADAVQACWINSAPANPDGVTVANIFSSPTCQTWDNESTSTRYQAARSVLGLPAGNYSVAVRMLADQNQPDAHATTGSLGLLESPITMLVDAMAIYNDPLPGAILNTTGQRYETSFVNRVVDDTFLYYGSRWRSFSGTRYTRYSGRNYDNTSNQIGAGVVFRTDNADTLIFYRDTRTGYSPLEICVQRLSDNMRRCAIHDNAGGTANQAAINIPLFDTNPHVVSISTMYTGTFNLDAFELVDTTIAATTAVLQPGLHQETHPGIGYSISSDRPIVAPCTAAAPCPTYADWRNVIVSSYNGGRAMQSNTDNASVSFTFNGTGFSLITLFDVNSSPTVEVTVTGGLVTFPDNPDDTFSLNSTSTRYGSAYSLTGLPAATYTVTLTDALAGAKHRMTVDAIEVYGAYEAGQVRVMTPGFYDNAATNINGDTFPSYGPGNGAWTATTGVAGYLNQSRHLTNRYGAHITFQVQNADSITLFDKSSTTTAVEVCWITTGGGTRNCEIVNTVTELTVVPDGNLNDIQTLDFGAMGNYNVSITNLAHAQNFYLDGIGVQDTSAPPLTEGIYQQDHPEMGAPNTTLGGTWAIVADSVATDGFVRSATGNGASMEFDFTGTGFSILLSESTLTSNSYTVNITPGAVNDITNDVLTNPPTSTTKKLVALTYVGLNAGTYTVTLTNNDATRPLLVDRVDILGPLATSEQIAADNVSNVENTDRRITYLPFGSQTLTNATAASGGNQSFLAIQGSVIYFELNNFNGAAINYVRQISASYGLVDICLNDFGIALVEPCDTPNPGDAAVSNAAGTAAYQVARNVLSVVGNNWVAIRNLDGRSMPLDFIRATDASAPLTAGYYEETYHDDPLTVPDDNPIFNFNGAWTPVTVASASGGTVMSTTTVGDTALFQFNGTGFSVYFTLDRFADAVEFCWVNGAETDPANVEPGDPGVTCQSYDNQSAATRYRAARTILGLPSGVVRTAVVRMLADNGVPAAHVATALPLTMQIDAIRIYGENPATLLTPLDTLNTRYETSFVNAAADNRFLYLGNGWTSTSGTAARLYSGSNYDRNLNTIGAGVVFRTNNADAIVLYRDTAASYQPLEVCAIGGAGRRCMTILNNGGTGRTQPFGVLLNTTNDTGPHTVTITTLGFSPFILDAVEIVDTSAALTAGLYEEAHPALQYSETVAGVAVTGDWSPIYSRSYSDGRMMQTTARPTDFAAVPDPTNPDGLMSFSFMGTGFEIGTLVDRYGGEVLVCYESGTIANPLDIDANCYRYQNESSATRATVSRSVAGLTAGTYSVRVQNVEDGMSNLTATPVARLATYAVARLRVDYVRVFNATPPVVTEAGWYNENAVDDVSGEPFLQLLPAERWASVTGRSAAAFSNQSYVNVVASNGRASTIYAGPLATLSVGVPNPTVILYTGTAVSSNSDQVLVCTNNVADTGNNCVIGSMKTANQVVVDSSDLPALAGATPLNPVNVTFRGLTTSGFKIDGFQIISGTTLTAGIYDSVLAGPNMVLDTDDTPGTWPTFNATSAYNRSLVRTNNRDATLTFDFQGTGFSVITHNDASSVDMRICYADTTGAGFDGTFATYPAAPNSTAEVCEYIGAVVSFVGTNPNITSINMWNGASQVTINTADAEIRGVIANNARVRVLTTSVGGAATATEVWVVPTTSFYQFGYAYYGLLADTYAVEVRHVDNSTTSLQYLRVDAVAVFGNAPTAMGPGLYDDATAAINFSPEPFWTVTTAARFGPPRGPYQLTEHTAANHGSIAQLNITGNGFILYQTAQSRNSRTVRVCLVIPSQPNECSDFSQNVPRATYFTPIAFYGFGSGANQIIIENRSHGTTNNLSVDGGRVLP